MWGERLRRRMWGEGRGGEGKCRGDVREGSGKLGDGEGGERVRGEVLGCEGSM